MRGTEVKVVEIESKRAGSAAAEKSGEGVEKIKIFPAGF
jgi:hypothetical protein